MATSTGRRTYSAEFKAEAVARVRDGEAIRTVAEELGVSASSLRTWVTQSPEEEAARAAVPVPETVITSTPAPVDDGCMVCGRGPAEHVKLRSVVGMVIAFRWSHVEGRFCRDCGTAMSREVLNKTLLTGWWGLISFFTNWYAVFVDTKALWRFRNMPEPIGAPRATPLAAGKSLLARAGVYVGVVAMLIAGTILVAFSAESDASDFDGKCVSFDAGHTKVLERSCGDSHDGKVVAVVTDRSDCPATTDGSMRLEADDDNVLCVDLDQ